MPFPSRCVLFAHEVDQIVEATPSFLNRRGRVGNRGSAALNVDSHCEALYTTAAADTPHHDRHQTKSPTRLSIIKQMLHTKAKIIAARSRSLLQIRLL